MVLHVALHPVREIVVTQPEVGGLQRSGQPGADHGRGHHRDERHAGERQQELRHLLGRTQRRIGDRRPGRVQERQVQRIAQ
jgi:hypothetical protein